MLPPAFKRRGRHCPGVKIYGTSYIHASTGSVKRQLPHSMRDYYARALTGMQGQSWPDPNNFRLPGCVGLLRAATYRLSGPGLSDQTDWARLTGPGRNKFFFSLGPIYTEKAGRATATGLFKKTALPASAEGAEQPGPLHCGPDCTKRQAPGLGQGRPIARALRWRAATHRRQIWPVQHQHLVRQCPACPILAAGLGFPHRQPAMRQRMNRANPFRQHHWQQERGLCQLRSRAGWHFRSQQAT